MARKYDIFGEPIEKTDDEILIELEEEASRNDDSYVYSFNDGDISFFF